MDRTLKDNAGCEYLAEDNDDGKITLSSKKLKDAQTYSKKFIESAIAGGLLHEVSDTET